MKLVYILFVVSALACDAAAYPLCAAKTPQRAQPEFPLIEASRPIVVDNHKQSQCFAPLEMKDEPGDEPVYVKHDFVPLAIKQDHKAVVQPPSHVRPSLKQKVFQLLFPVSEQGEMLAASAPHLPLEAQHSENDKRAAQKPSHDVPVQRPLPPAGVRRHRDASRRRADHMRRF